MPAAAAPPSPLLPGDSTAAAAAAAPAPPNNFGFGAQQVSADLSEEGLSAGGGLSAGFMQPEVSLPRWGVRVRHSRQHQVKLEGSEVMMLPAAAPDNAVAAAGSLPLSGHAHSPQPSTAGFWGVAGGGGGGGGGTSAAVAPAWLAAQQQQQQQAPASAAGAAAGVTAPVGDDGDLSDSCSQVRRCCWHGPWEWHAYVYQDVITFCTCVGSLAECVSFHSAAAIA
jgi:hypothetical protein